MEVPKLFDKRTHLAGDETSTPTNNVTVRKKRDYNISIIDSLNLLLDEVDLNLTASSETLQISKLNRSCPEIGEDFHGKLDIMNKKLLTVQE